MSPSSHLRILALTALTFAPAPAADLFGLGGPARPARASSSLVVDGGLGARLDAAVRGLAARRGAFHGAVLVARGDHILLERGYGLAQASPPRPMRPDTLFNWASVSKQFTAAALLRLQQDGELRLDDPLHLHLTGVPADKRGITLRHLLQHTSGVEQTEADAANTRAAAVARFLACGIAAPPGAVFDYNNDAYTVAAAVIELRSGMDYEDYVSLRLFRPAAMDDATFFTRALDRTRLPLARGGTGILPAEAGEPAIRFRYGDEPVWDYKGAGGVVATVGAMWRWDRALRTDAVLDAAARAELYRPALEDYALGWEIGRSTSELLYTHSGDVPGVAAVLLRGASSGVVVAIDMSERDQEGFVVAMAEQLYALVTGARVQVPGDPG